MATEFTKKDIVVAIARPPMPSPHKEMKKKFKMT